MRISDWSSDVCSSDLAEPATVLSQERLPDVGTVGPSRCAALGWRDSNHRGSPLDRKRKTSCAALATGPEPLLRSPASGHCARLYIWCRDRKSTRLNSSH